MSDKPQLSPGLKLALDLGPLILFFIANTRPALFAPILSPFLAPELLTGPHAGIFAATAVFIPAILIALAISYALTRHLPVMPVVTAIIVVVFGGATLILQDEQFIKIKPPSSMCCSAVYCWAGSRSASRCSAWCSIPSSI